MKHAPQAKPGAKRTFQQKGSVFQRGWSGLAVDCDSVLGNRSVEKLYVWNLYSFLRSFPGTHVAFQTCEKLTRLFKVQRQSLSGHAVCLYNLFVHHTLP